VKYADMRETELAVRHRGCPVSDVSNDHPGVRFENVRRVRSAAGRAKRLLCFEGERSDVSAFAEDFRAHPAAVGLERVSSDGDGTGSAYYISEIEYPENNPSILHLVERAGCFRHPKVVVRGGIEHWTLYTRRKESVREFVDTVEGLDNDVEVLRNVDVGRLGGEADIQHAPLRAALTDRQAETFRTALSLGYYERDSRVTVEDIAEALGVHRSTAGEHVKRAENTILSEIGGRLFPTRTADT
jgi:predicted DNA binding protein